MIPTVEELEGRGWGREEMCEKMLAPARERVTGTDEDVLLAAMHIFITDHTVSCDNCGQDEDVPTVMANLYALAQVIQVRRMGEN